MTQVDELIQMPNECPGCHQPWSMTVGEKQFFEDIIERKTAEGKEFSMPTHCKSCRDKKKGTRITPESIISKVESMIRRADNGDYALEIDDLVDDLKSVSKMLKTMFPRPQRRRSDKIQEEAVGEPAASGSVQAES
jgi:hypothetical protein